LGIVKAIKSPNVKGEQREGSLSKRRNKGKNY